MDVEREKCLIAEYAAAGCILSDGGSFERMLPYVSEAEFSQHLPRMVFHAAGKLFAAGRIIDIATIHSCLAAEACAIEVEKLAKVRDKTPNVENAAEYAKAVREAARKRKIDALTVNVREDTAHSSDELLSKLSGGIDAMAQDFGDCSAITSEEAVSTFMNNLGDRQDGVDNVVSTGYPSLDRVLGGGLLKSGLYVIAARPGMGKTSFALNIADQIRGTVLYVSLEMSTDQLTAKRIARVSGIPASRLLMHAEFSDEEWQKITKAAKDVHYSSVILNRKFDTCVSDIALLARSAKNLAAVVVDYIGLIRPAVRGSRYEQITEISGALKRLAISLNVPILALSQLSRATESREDRRPQLSDLRDSGAIEQDADGVLLLYREDYYEEGVEYNPMDPAMIECNVAKNRHAGTGIVKFNAYLIVNRITEMRLPKSCF